MKETTWLLIEVDNIDGKNEKQRYILQNVSFNPTRTTISAYCLKVHPATEETKE